MDASTSGVVIEDFEERSSIISAFRSAVKCYNYFYPIVFLECCKHYNFTPTGLNIKHKSFIQFDSQDMTTLWECTIQSTERQLMESLLFGLHEKMLTFEIHFWNELSKIEESIEYDELLEWWVKLAGHLENEQTKIVNRKRKKIKKMLKDDNDKLDVWLV